MSGLDRASKLARLVLLSKKGTIHMQAPPVLKRLHDLIQNELVNRGATIKNTHALTAPPCGSWIYLEFSGCRFKLQLESLDEAHTG